MTNEIRWRAWAAGVFGVVIRPIQDGSFELRYANEIAVALNLEQADAYLRFWQARQAMKAAGCAAPSSQMNSQDAEPTFHLELTRLPPRRRQLRLCLGRP